MYVYYLCLTVHDVAEYNNINNNHSCGTLPLVFNEEIYILFHHLFTLFLIVEILDMSHSGNMIKYLPLMWGCIVYNPFYNMVSIFYMKIIV